MKIVRGILKVISFSVGVCVLLLILFATITQTEFFKNRIRTIIVSRISQNSNAHLHLGAIRGNFLTGIEIDSLSIDYGELNLLSTGSITIEQDPLTLLRKTVTVGRLTIEHPRIRLIRSLDNEWNFSRILRGTNDSSESTFDWLVILNNLEIRDGTVTLIDSAALASPEHSPELPGEFEYHDFCVQNLNVRANLAIQKNSISAIVKSITLFSSSPQFNLTRFAGEFKVDEEGISARNVVIQTGKSSLQCQAVLSGPNIFKGIVLSRLQYDPLQLQLAMKKLDFSELRMFLPAVDMLNGSASLDLDAAGEFENINVKRLNVQTYSTELKIAGTVKNLHQPRDLHLDLFLGDSKIDPSDAARLLPNMNIPRLEGVERFSVFAQYAGRPLNFKVSSTLKGEHESLELAGQVNLEETQPRYDLTFASSRLNIGKLVGVKNWEGSLSSHGELHGTGFSLDSIAGHFKIAVDSARIQKYVFTRSNVEINASPHRFESSSTVELNGLHAVSNLKLVLTNPRIPAWEGDMSVNSMDVSKLFDGSKYRTDISLRASFKGSGKTADDLSTNASIFLLPSSINQHKLNEQELHLTLDQHDPVNKHLSINSEIFDAHIDGKFDLDLLASTLPEQATNLARKIERHMENYDTVDTEERKVVQAIERHKPEQREQDFKYTISIKNLGPLTSILSAKPINANGRLSGEMHGTDEHLSFTCNGAFEDFFVGTIQQGILLHQSRFTVSAESLSIRHTLRQLSSSVELTVESGLLNSVALENVHGSLRYGQREGKYSLSAVVDSLYQLAVSGKLQFEPQTYAFDVDTLTVGSGNYVWRNEDDVQTRLNASGFRIMHAVMKHNKESMELTGSVDTSGMYDITLALRRIELQEMPFRTGTRTAQRTTNFAGSVTADLRLTGTARSPVFDVILNGQDISYRQTLLGNVAMNINYKDLSAVLDVTVKSTVTDSFPRLSLKGELPINLAFSDVVDRFPDEEQNIRIVSDRFNINVLEPLFPELENLTGELGCNILFSGSPMEPEYHGMISIRNARFVLEPNNITYTVNGDLEPSADKLELRNFVIKNIPEDRTDGEARLEGTLKIKNFQVDSLDLTAYGQLLVMSEATRRSIQTMYGTLFTAFDAAGLRITGTLQHPRISGKVLVRDQNVVLPPTKETGFLGSTLTLPYVVIDDTSKPGQQKQSFAERFYTNNDTTVTVTSGKNPEVELSFVRRLDYDLGIETQGPTRIRMVFTPSTNEELYAELDGKVSLINNQGVPNVYGEISISPGSYYNFLKRFDATGQLRFIGQWDNPVLQIVATYEGYHQKDSLEQKVIVQLDISGTRYQPQLTMSMKVQLEPGKDPVDWSTQSKGGDIQSDAISFIMTGKFRDELTSKDKENIVSNVGQSASSSMLSGFTTSFLSGMLTDFLRKEFPFIRSAEVSYGGGGFQESADLRLSGEAFKGYWRFGGKILNDIGNANVNYQLNLGDVFNAHSVRNVFLEFERKVEGSEFSEDRKLTNAARLYYRLSF